jgi:uncharacterized membrane protein
VPVGEELIVIRPSSPLARSAALGVATGSRASYGVAAVAWSSPPTSPGLLGRLAGERGRKVTAVCAGLETVLDPLPFTPSRLRPPGLVSRLVNGAGAAVLIARRDGEDPVQAARVGAFAAGAGAIVGVTWRRFGSRAGRRDLPHALIEDGVAAALALWGARP